MDNWISVKDRLPQKDTVVLAVDKRGTIFFGISRIYYFDPGGLLYLEEAGKAIDRPASYWLPMPESPRQ